LASTRTTVCVRVFDFLFPFQAVSLLDLTRASHSSLFGTAALFLLASTEPFLSPAIGFWKQGKLSSSFSLFLNARLFFQELDEPFSELHLSFQLLEPSFRPSTVTLGAKKKRMLCWRERTHTRAREEELGRLEQEGCRPAVCLVEVDSG